MPRMAASVEMLFREVGLLDRFELRELSDRLLSSLSYGQLRRALIARTLTNQPRVLLLDEPFEGLDQRTQAIVRAQLDEIVADGTQLVCASHRADIRTRFTHELVIENGRIAKTGARPLSYGDVSGGPRES